MNTSQDQVRAEGAYLSSINDIGMYHSSAREVQKAKAAANQYMDAPEHKLYKDYVMSRMISSKNWDMGSDLIQDISSGNHVKQAGQLRDHVRELMSTIMSSDAQKPEYRSTLENLNSVDDNVVASAYGARDDKSRDVLDTIHGMKGLLPLISSIDQNGKLVFSNSDLGFQDDEQRASFMDLGGDFVSSLENAALSVKTMAGEAPRGTPTMRELRQKRKDILANQHFLLQPQAQAVPEEITLEDSGAQDIQAPSSNKPALPAQLHPEGYYRQASAFGETGSQASVPQSISLQPSVLFKSESPGFGPLPLPEADDKTIVNANLKL